jgi:hypothetical protein
MVIAPGLGHSSIQAAQNQHSSGYRTMGGFFFSGLGIITSVGHTSTQRLQPLHISGLNFCPLLGVIGLGVIYTLSLMSDLLLISKVLAIVEYQINVYRYRSSYRSLFIDSGYSSFLFRVSGFHTSFVTYKRVSLSSSELKTTVELIVFLIAGNVGRFQVKVKR